MFGNPDKIVNSLNGNTEWNSQQLADGARLAALIREGKSKGELREIGFSHDSLGVWFHEGNLIYQPLLRGEPFPNPERAAVADAAKK